MIDLEIPLLGLVLLALSSSVSWVFYRRHSRGGLKVQFFTDRLSRNVSIVAIIVLAICVLSVLAINIFLLLTHTNDSPTFSSSMMLIVVAPLLSTLADVEGVYGTGIYVKVDSCMTKVEASDLSLEGDRLFIGVGSSSLERTYVATKENFMSLQKTRHA